jgi:hypothetical protein
MKKNRIYLLLILILTSVVVSNCKKSYTLDPPPSSIDGINGSWELYSVIQVDEFDLAKPERNISKFYLGEGSSAVMEITFNSSDLTFEITLGQIGKNYLPTSGTWKFDDDNFPQYIYLKDDEGNVTTLTLQGPIRPQDQQLKYSFDRSCTINGEFVPYVGYRYEYNRK